MLIEDRRVIYKTVNDVFKISSVICWEFVVVVASSKKMLTFTISVKEVNVFLFQIIFKSERE